MLSSITTVPRNIGSNGVHLGSVARSNRGRKHAPWHGGSARFGKIRTLGIKNTSNRSMVILFSIPNLIATPKVFFIGVKQCFTFTTSTAKMAPKKWLWHMIFHPESTLIGQQRCDCFRGPRSARHCKNISENNMAKTIQYNKVVANNVNP